MLTKKETETVFAGLTGMPGIPLEKQAVRLRFEAFRLRARSEGHGERVVKHLRETLQFFPTEAQIVEACEMTPDDSSLTESSRDCSYCHGELWIAIEGPYGLSAVHRCNHNGPVPVNVGVRLTPSMQRHYAAEAEAARLRRDAWYQAQAETPDLRWQANEYQYRQLMAGVE